MKKIKLNSGLRTSLQFFLLALVTFIALIVLLGCDSVPTEYEEYDPEPVLTAYIEAEQPMSTVRLEWVGSFAGTYNRESLGITGASIAIYPLEDENSIPIDSSGRAVYFVDDSTTRGLYQAIQPEIHLPVSGWSYRIEASHHDLHAPITAQTAVPGVLSMEVVNYSDLTPPQSAIPDFDQEDPTIQLAWEASSEVGGYLLMVTCIESRDSLIYLDPDRLDDEDEDDDQLDQYTMFPMRDDQHQMNIPWMYFIWRGTYKIDLMSVSADYYRYVYTLNNEMEENEHHRVEDNVENGLGIFAATSLQSFILEMKPVED